MHTRRECYYSAGSSLNVNECRATRMHFSSNSNSSNSSKVAGATFQMSIRTSGRPNGEIERLSDSMQPRNGIEDPIPDRRHGLLEVVGRERPMVLHTTAGRRWARRGLWLTDRVAGIDAKLSFDLIREARDRPPFVAHVPERRQPTGDLIEGRKSHDQRGRPDPSKRTSDTNNHTESPRHTTVHNTLSI